MRLAASPTTAQAMTVVTTPTRKRQTPMNAAPARVDRQPVGVAVGIGAWRATKTARAAITPTTAMVMPLSELAKEPVWRMRSMIGAPLMMKTKRGDEGAEGGDGGAGESPGEPAFDVVAGEEADEGVDHDQRAGCGLAEGEAGDHVLGGQPAVVVDGGAGDERGRGIRRHRR